MLLWCEGWSRRAATTTTTAAAAAAAAAAAEHAAYHLQRNNPHAAHAAQRIIQYVARLGVAHAEERLSVETVEPIIDADAGLIRPSLLFPARFPETSDDQPVASGTLPADVVRILESRINADAQILGCGHLHLEGPHLPTLRPIGAVDELGGR